MTIVFEDLALIAKQIATFPATAALKGLGLTDDQLEQVGFHHKDRYLPVAQRRLTMPSSLTGGRTPLDFGYMLALFTQFAMFRYAVLDGYEEINPDFDGAWQHVNAALVDWNRKAYLERQRDKAKRPRRIISEIKTGMREFVAKYATAPDNLPLRPLELWSKFGPYMRDHRIDAELVGNSYEHTDGTIKFTTFSNYVREGRKSVQQRG